jgi:hypothetical protein
MATLRIVRGPNVGTQVTLEKDVTVIGRSPDCDVVVPHPAISRQHARVIRREGWFLLEDLRSRGGTYLNGRRIPGLSALRDGNRILLASVEAVFESPVKAMTEEDWLAEGNSQSLLAWLRRHVDASERRLRLFAVACYRHGRLAWPDERSAAVAEHAERLVEETWPLLSRETGHDPEMVADAWQTAVDSARNGAGMPASGRKDWWTAFMQAEDTLCRLVRDVFGNPFRTRPPFEPAWRNDLVMSLAQAAYGDRTFPEGTLNAESLAVLADAVEEVGCTDRNLLDHLRGPGPHVRACHALDWILGRP